MNDDQKKMLLIHTLRAGGYFSINKKLVKSIGLMPAMLISLYLEKQMYFEKHNPENDGWFYFTRKQIQDETDFSDHTVIQVKKKLMELNLIQIERRGIPSIEWIKIDTNALLEILISQTASCNDGAQQAVGNLHSLPDETSTAYNNNKEEKKNKKDNKDKENNKSFSSSISVASKNDATVSDNKNKIYIPIVDKLVDIITSKKRIKIDGHKKSGWANSVRQLVERDGVEIDRVETALEWYSQHHMDDYVPVIESGKSLREKFIKLESAIERDKSPKRSRGFNSGYSDLQPLVYKKPKIV